ncbi:hypothetical protein BST81_10905 [Leptolyngbya sp. 'hensonii']|uniref:2-phosphosulfolactate phosphatase n=1 Tax=Leptolyngbya sp. 'hensonii' TaxID=1922337 RepID=UPI0009502CDC|nr:2-phosphosulfolactate phosphatase [Leptolyngbya sp. 'hensonii']OLP18384.1 hypothetical protein BST81_10905 [Leptolyngbya sp. 'hensonii']
MKDSPNSYVSMAIKDFQCFGSSTTREFTDKAKYLDRDFLNQTAILCIDILRATTTMTVAVAAGCEGIHLVIKPTGGEYELTPPLLPHKNWIFGGEENGLPIPGGMLNNSPLSIQPDQLVGKWLKFYSTNGAKSLTAIADLQVGAVFLVSLANIESTLDAIKARGFTRYWIVGAGFYQSPALEDTVCGGRIIQTLLERQDLCLDALDDGARIMCHTSAPYQGQDDLLIQDLYHSQVAKLLCNIGRCEDVPACINGTGIPSSLWERMTHAVIHLEYIDGTPILISR